MYNTRAHWRHAQNWTHKYVTFLLSAFLMQVFLLWNVSSTILIEITSPNTKKNLLHFYPHPTNPPQKKTGKYTLHQAGLIFFEMNTFIWIWLSHGRDANISWIKFKRNQKHVCFIFKTNSQYIGYWFPFAASKLILTNGVRFDNW